MATVCPPQAVGTLEAILLCRGCARKPEQRSSLGSPQLGVSDDKSAQIPIVLLADSCACECEEAVVAVKLVNAHLLLCFVSWSGGILYSHPPVHGPLPGREHGSQAGRVKHSWGTLV